MTRRRLVSGLLFASVSAVAVACFAWPFVLPATAADGIPWSGIVACAVIPVLAVAAVVLVDRGVASRPDSAKFVALLGLLAAVGAVTRLFASAAGGIEAVFIVLILGGAAFGPRFGFLLGTVTIGASAVLWGMVGPWTPFQMFAAAWVGAGAGGVSLLIRRMSRHRLTSRGARWGEIGALTGYGILVAYLYGALLNLWFWPFAVGNDTSISYVSGANPAENMSHFVVYTLLTSTLTWDTVRAVTTTVGVVVLGPVLLSALRRAKLERA